MKAGGMRSSTKERGDLKLIFNNRNSLIHTVASNGRSSSKALKTNEFENVMKKIDTIESKLGRMSKK